MNDPGRTPSDEWLASTLERIEAQRAIVNTLRPGSAAHRSATDLLLLLQDCLHTLNEAAYLLDDLTKSRLKKR